MITDGIASLLTLQRETDFNAGSAEPIYFVAGKTGFSFDPILDRGYTTRNVWRQDTKVTHSRKFYRGSVNFELGLNEITRLILASFFELNAATDIGGGLTKYEFRPRRLADFGSFKFGLENSPAGPNIAFHGAVIDSIDLSLSLRALARISVGLKFVRREDDVLMSESAEDAMEVSSLDHIHSAISIDGTDQEFLQEFAMKFADPKSPLRFTEAGEASRFGADGVFSVEGNGLEIANSESLIEQKVESLAEGEIIARLYDRENALRYFQIAWPRVVFTKGIAHGIAQGELTSRFAFTGLNDSALDIASEPLLTIVL